MAFSGAPGTAITEKTTAVTQYVMAATNTSLNQLVSQALSFSTRALRAKISQTVASRIDSRCEISALVWSGLGRGSVISSLTSVIAEVSLT